MTANLPSEPAFLGIEGGATHTVALLVDDHGRILRRAEAGPANVRLLSDAQLLRLFRALRKETGAPVALAVGMAGARLEADRGRIRRAAAKVWPGVPCYATNDLETGLMAAEQRPEASSRKSATKPPAARVLVLSGTGSCCFGRGANGQTVKVGGWGHILGDRGSGYDIGLRTLRRMIDEFDRTATWPALGQRLLRALLLNDPEELVGWAQSAGKPDIAALAVEVFAAWNQGDRLATEVLEDTADTLAQDAAACARRLARPGSPVQFVFNGSVLLKQPRFARWVGARLRRLWPKAIVTPLQRDSVWGAVELARIQSSKLNVQPSTFNLQPSMVATGPIPEPENREVVPLRSLAQSPTEQRNPRSMKLDQLSLERAIALMLSEDAKIPPALLAERKPIERGIQLIVRAFRQGGRLFYVGAGTSGRLGVLDASECPPTFSAPPDLVQGIMAGGQRALWQSIEGAEDDPAAGAQAVAFRGVGRHDVVVGIAASGRTPFVWGALAEARQRRAKTILLCFNPHLRIPSARRPTVVIAPQVGPEVLTGSTRLKAGTATKLVLNLLTTLAMVKLGKVRSNLMIDVKASNTKLRDRATRIVCDLTGADYKSARAVLEKSGWQIKAACARWQRRSAK